MSKTQLFLYPKGKSLILAYDTFTRANGAPGSTETTGPDGKKVTARTWLTSTGAVDTNKLKLVPTVGAELVTNGDMSSAVGWTVGANWNIAAGVATHTTGAATDLSQNILAVDELYLSSFDITRRVAGATRLIWGDNNGPAENAVNTYTYTALCTTVTDLIIRPTSTFDGDVDNVSTKLLSRPSCIAGISDGVNRYVYETVAISALPVNRQAGILLGLDSIVAPLNYLYIYYNYIDSNIYVDSITAGAVTNISTVATAYVDGADLEARHDGTNLYVWYNAAAVMNSATPIPGTGTIHGVFATDTTTRFDNFLVAKPAYRT